MKKNELIKIVKKASKGDSGAFEKLIEVKLESILFNALNVMDKYHDAEDVTQEVITKVYKNIHKLKDPESFNGWLQRIITNECYSMKRKPIEKKENIAVKDQFNELTEEDREFLPQECAENKEQRDVIKNIIHKLPSQRKRMVIMYYYDELSYKEIAYALDTTVSVVASNLSRAKIQIKNAIEESSSMDIKSFDNKKLASVPVLTQVLSEEAVEVIPRKSLQHLINFTKIQMPGNMGNVASASFFSMKTIGVVIATTAIITSGVAFSINMVKSASENTKATSAIESNQQKNDNAVADVEYKGDIIFESNDCDCGHVNPEEIQAILENQSYDSISYVISSDEGKEILTEISGSLTKEPKQLYKDKKDGNYLIKFTVDYGNKKIYIERDFLIDTGDIKDKKYK